MDFHSLPRRDLQFLCKKNKIPANMTNVAMADALKALEIVEGLVELLNQTELTAPPSPTSVAKEFSATRTARRTTQRKATKEETQTSQSVTRSCRVTRKSLAGEMDQENRNMNMLQSPAVPPSRRRVATSVAQESEINDGETENDVKLEDNMSKTPAARTTRRKAALPASSRSRAPDTKKNESVQQVYSTRRSVRLLEKCMADLSLKPKEDLDEPAGFEFQGKSDDKSERTEETEVIPGRDLTATLEKEWDMRDECLEDDNGSTYPDPETEGNETQFDLGDISVSNAKSETCKEKMVQDNVCQGCDSEETEAEEKVFAESEAIQAFNSSLQVEGKELSQAKALSPSEKMIQDNDSNESGHAASATSPVTCKDILDSELENVDPEKVNEKDDDGETMMDKAIDEALRDDTVVNEGATLSVNTDKDSAHHGFQDDEASESEQRNTDSDDSESKYKQTEANNDSADLELHDDTDSESEQSNTDSDDSESESEQTKVDTDTEVDPEEDNSAVVDSALQVFRSDVAVNDASLTVDKVEEVESDISGESSETDQSETESDSEEEDPEEDSFSDADSNTAVFGSDVCVLDADEEPEDPESEENENLNDNKTEESDVTASDKKAPASPLPMSANKGTTPMSPFTAESMSGQFPRPTLTTTPAKSSSKKKQSSALKLSILADNDTINKENTESYSGVKAAKPEKTKKKKRNAVDEESLKDASLRQLTKMVKELTIKSNRTALQTLPDNRIAEQN